MATRPSVRTGGTWNEAAEIAGTSGAGVSQWLDKLEYLGINQIARVNGTQSGSRFGYIDFNYFPVGTFGYGFRYAPSDDPVANTVLQSWTNNTMKALGDDWFYYEGHWRP